MKEALLLLLILVLVRVLIFLRRSMAESKETPFTQPRGAGTTHNRLKNRNTTQRTNQVLDAGKDVTQVQVSAVKSATLTGEHDRTNVISASVDELEKYKLFKDRGYLSKAVDILFALVESNKQYQTATYIADLTDMCIKIKAVDKLAELLEQYHALIDRDAIKALLVRGFKIEPDNYQLQLVCKKILLEDPIGLGATAITN